MESGRDIYEFANFDSPIDTDIFSVQNWLKTAWKQNWTDSLVTETSYTYRNTDFEGRDNEEDASQVALSAIYQATNRLSVALDSAYTHQKSKIGTSLIRRTFTFRTDYSL